MSTEALAFVKMLELGDAESPATRFVMYVLGENTFNDSFRCVLSQEQVAFEAGRMSVRSLRRQLDTLSDDSDGKNPFIVRTPRFDCTGRRIEDAIEIAGFEAWYLERTNNRKGRARDAVKAAAAARGVPAKLSGGYRPNCPGVPDTAMSGGTGQQESGHVEARTSNRTSEDAREGVRSEVLNFDLEGKAVRDRLLERFGFKIFQPWFADAAFSLTSVTAAAVAAPTKFKRDWLKTHYEAAIREACQAEWPSVVRVEYRCRKAQTRGAAA